MAAQQIDAFVQMQQQMTALQQQLVQQQQQHGQFAHDAQAAAAIVAQQHGQQLHDMQVAAAAAVVAADARRQPTVRIAPPPSYDGAATTIDDWLSALAQQFAYHRMVSHDEQIRTAVAHLKGPALDWYSHIAARPATMLEFEAGLRLRFQPVTTEQTARERLQDLEQGPRGSINEYVEAYRRLVVAIPGMDAASQMFHFARGLRPALQTMLRMTPPANLEAAIALAVRVGAASSSASCGAAGGSAMDLSALGIDADDTAPPPVTMASIQELFAAYVAKGRNNGSGMNGRGAQGASGGFRGARGPPQIPGFTEAKVKQYMDEGRCFGCHLIGHRSNVCPKRVVSADGKVSWLK